ncbi:DUF5666 domain-containing protein [Kitasatospora aureofaciens]|uniref:Uncharacterized protein n=1 Tax=Kitasatospora aureofaciens TaxID=1894 RepID=A0A1E7N4A5_KITAU|nr:DUF5666 domain-containing protein [Kitasatospora aureofaciens]ARF79391.1 hypothetical protein B6264_11080 [Kitasatospora aureofaciens]OEV35502.1 hypothetical protein HS99_0031890 [Kitasatospora aureofaciens]GGU66658.1 hypothetical protein GCM10010502_17150 [Kitasatospora aureofaciens]
MEHDEQVALLSTPPDARDVSAELAAPPRRKLPWLSLVLAGGVIATGAFAGGVWYQQGQGTSSGKSSSPRAASAGAPATGGGYGQGAGGRRGGQGQGQGQGQGGFTRGTVKAVDGSTVYLTDANGNTVKVTTGDSTKVQLNKEGKVADLQPGQSVTVVGTPDANGGYNASQLVEGSAGGGFGGGGFGGGNRNPSGG